MKLLLDTCVWGGAKRELEHLGHDVIWTGDWPSDPGDEEILAFATTEQRILVTLDKDFGELVFLKGRSHCGILRIQGIPSRLQAFQIHQVLEKFGPSACSGALITLNDRRVKIRTSMPVKF